MTVTEKLQKARNTKSTRLWVIGILMVVVFLLWWFKILKTGFVIGIGIILLAAFGIETLNYDIDLGRLWDTGSVQESRVEHRDGMKIFGQTCAGDNLNCSDFQTQEEAQAKYEECARQIATDNKVSEESVKNLDVYRLDGDKDGIVCEALPKGV